MGRGVVKDRNNYWSGTQTFERILVEDAIFLTGATFDLSGGNIILPSTLDSGAVQAKDNTGLKLQNDGGTEIFRVDDSGHIGLFGTANSSWGTDYRAVEGPNTTWLMSALPTGNEAHFVSHAYIDNAGWKYKTASEIPIKSTYGAGVFHISTANSGLVGDPLTWVDRLTVNTGGVGINNSTPSGSLDARSLQTDLGTTVTAANSDASKALFLYSGHDNQAPTLFWRGGLGMAFGTGYDYTSGASQSSPTNYFLNQTFHVQGGDSGGLSNPSAGVAVICDGNAGTYYSVNTNSTTSARGYAFIPNTGVGIHGRVIRAISFVSMAGYLVGDFKFYGRASSSSFTTNPAANGWTLLVQGNSTSVDVNSPDVFGFTNSTVFTTYMVHFTTSGEHRIAEMGMFEEVGFVFTKRMEILSNGNVEVANTLNANTLQEGNVDLSTKYILANQKGATNGICELSNGVVPNNRIPPLAISETSVVANLAAKYALTTQRGDIAIVTGTSQTFIKLNDDAATTNSADWTELIPNGAVVSVNGDTGPVVSIDTSQIAENTNLYYTNARVDGRIASASINTLTDVGLALSAGNANKALKINAAANGVDQTTFSLPVSNGSDGQVLTSDGAGNTAWEDSITSGTFLSLSDTPSAFVAGYEVKVNSSANGLVFEPFSKSFKDLTDTPANFTSSGDKVVTVKTDTSGLEFTSAQDLIRSTQAPTTTYATTSTVSSYDHNLIFAQPTSADIALTLPTTGTSLQNMTARFYIKNVSGTHRVIVRGLSGSDHPQSEKLSASDSTASAGSFVLHPRESAVFQGFNGSGNYRVIANYRDDITQIVTSNTTQTKSAKNFVVTGTTALTIDLLDYPFWPLNTPILFKNSSTKELTLDPHLSTSIEGSASNIKVPAGRSVTIQRIAASTLSIVDSSRAFDLDSSGNAIFESGRVGIGTSGPSAELDVAGEINFSGSNDSFVTSLSQPRIYRSGDDSGSYPFDNFGNLILQTRTDGSNRDVVFATGTNGANLTVINSEGRVGIGTSAPSARLHIVESTNSTPAEIILSSSDTSVTPENFLPNKITFHQSDTSGSSAGTGVTGVIAMKSKKALNNSTHYGLASDMSFYVSGDTTAGAASDNASKEAMTIQRGTGNVGIGTVDPVSELDVNGVIRAGNNSSIAGGTALRVPYTVAGNHSANFGSAQSSGAPLIGYAVESSQSATDTFVSTANNVLWKRAALIVGPDLEFWNGAAQSVTVGSNTSMTRRFIVKESGNVGIGTTNPTEKIHSSGAIILGAAANTGLGTIQWTGSDFQGRTSNGWESLITNTSSFATSSDLGTTNTNLSNHTSSTSNPHSTTFTSLGQTPANFTGAAGKLVKVNSSGNALEFGDLSFADGSIQKTAASATSLMAYFLDPDDVFEATNCTLSTGSSNAGSFVKLFNIDLHRQISPLFHLALTIRFKNLTEVVIRRVFTFRYTEWSNSVGTAASQHGWSVSSEVPYPTSTSLDWEVLNAIGASAQYCSLFYGALYHTVPTGYSTFGDGHYYQSIVSSTPKLIGCHLGSSNWGTGDMRLSNTSTGYPTSHYLTYGTNSSNWPGGRGIQPNGKLYLTFNHGNDHVRNDVGFTGALGGSYSNYNWTAATSIKVDIRAELVYTPGTHGSSMSSANKLSWQVANNQTI